MNVKLGLLLLGSAVAGCSYTPHDLPDRGVAAVNVPVVARELYSFDAAAPSGMLPPSEAARLERSVHHYLSFLVLMSFRPWVPVGGAVR
jgi:pilus assembly protein CpaD